MKKIILHFFFILILLSIYPSNLLAQEKIPSAGESGLTEKLLKQSRPHLKPSRKEKPEIIIRDSRKIKDPGAGPAFFVKKIELEGNTIFDDEILAPIVDIGEGMELTLGILSLLAQEVTAYYATQGYFLAKTYIPKQEVKDGVIKMVVAEGQIGNLNVEGNKKIKTKDLLKRLNRIKKEKILKEQTLEQVLTELNELMGVKVRSILRPGELPGTSDLILEVTETPPYTFSFDGDNFGSRFTGKNRFGISASAGNLFRLGDQMSVRGVRSNLEQNYLQGSYLYPFTIPFTESDASFKVSYTYSEQTLGDTLSELKAGGKSNTLSMELSKMLFRSKTVQLQLKTAFDSRYSKNYQLEATSSKDNLNGFYLNLGGNAGDKYLGRSFFDFTLRRGLNLSDKNRTQASRSEGRGTIYVANASLIRRIPRSSAPGYKDAV